MEGGWVGGGKGVGGGGWGGGVGVGGWGVGGLINQYYLVPYTDL